MNKYMQEFIDSTESQNTQKVITFFNKNNILGVTLTLTSSCFS